MCLRSCSSLCTGRSRTDLPRSWAGSGTWPACGRSGNSSRRSDTGPSRGRWEDLQATAVRQEQEAEAKGVSLLTDGRQRGSGRLHTGAVVQHVPIGTGADGSAGAQQAEPLTFLAVTWIVH